MDNLRRILLTWKGRFLSIDGRVSLINYVFCNILIYIMSFFKAPKLVLEEIIKKQMDFLWHGCLKNKGISWVNWIDTCRPKEEGDLGIKNVEAFNM